MLYLSFTISNADIKHLSRSWGIARRLCYRGTFQKLLRSTDDRCDYQTNAELLLYYVSIMITVNGNDVLKATYYFSKLTASGLDSGLQAPQPITKRRVEKEKKITAAKSSFCHIVFLWIDFIVMQINRAHKQWDEEGENKGTTLNEGAYCMEVTMRTECSCSSRGRSPRPHMEHCVGGSTEGITEMRSQAVGTAAPAPQQSILLLLLMMNTICLTLAVTKYVTSLLPMSPSTLFFL